MSEAAAGRDSELLRSGCAELGIALTDEQYGKLLSYLELLYIWNRSAGLTTIARTDAVRLHLLDSLAAVDVAGSGPCLDLGSGGGLPGVVLAIALPGIPFVLVESNRRKCSFLLEAVRTGGIANVRVIEADYERLPAGERFPTVISRAFRPPGEFLAISRRFVEPGGRVVLLLADPGEVELRALSDESGFALESCRRLRLPGGNEPRAIATFRAS